MTLQFRLFSIFCITSGLFIAAAVASFLLRFGAAVEPEQINIKTIIFVCVFALFTQTGCFVAPTASYRPRPLGYLVVVFCSLWLLFFGSITLDVIGLSGGHFRGFWIVASAAFCTIANAFILAIVGNKLISTHDESAA